MVKDSEVWRVGCGGPAYVRRLWSDSCPALAGRLKCLSYPSGLTLNAEETDMARDVTSLVWDAALLGVVVIVIAVTVGQDYAQAINQGSDLAPELARRLGVPEDPMRTELTAALLKGLAGWIVIRVMPLCALAGLLTVRLLLDWRKVSSARLRCLAA